MLIPYLTIDNSICMDEDKVFVVSSYINEPYGPIANWTFDETLNDRISNNDWVNDTSTAIVYDTGKNGYCLKIENNSPFECIISTQKSAFECMNINRPWSFSYWFKQDNIANEYGSGIEFMNFDLYHRFNAKLDNNYIYQWPSLHIRHSQTVNYNFSPPSIDNNYTIERGTSGSNRILLNNGTNKFKPDSSTWYNTIITYDGNNTMRMYVNNELISVDVSYGSTSNYPIENVGNSQLFMTMDGNNNYSKYFYIDSMWVFDRELDEYERSLLWNNGNGI